MADAYDQLEKGLKWVMDNCTSYQVAKDLGINNRTINRYQNGESPLENMSLKTAKLIYNYYLKEMERLGPKYTVSAFKEFENQYGMMMSDIEKQEFVYDEEQAEKVAREMYEEGGYSAIYIEYAHTDSQCYYNPAVGHEVNGKDWIKHFENE